MKILDSAPNLSKTALLAVLAITSGLALASATRPVAGDGGGKLGFTNYEVAGNPFVTGYGVGTICPNSLMNCIKTEGEQQIRADNARNFYDFSEKYFRDIGGICGDNSVLK